MQTHISTTSFGRRPMTLGHIASQMAAKAVASDTVAHKWQVFQHIRESRGLIGATDRSLSILNALLTFYPETALTGGAELVVWPSNEQLMARANGMPATTLRRHLAILVDCGLIIRRDSPNGKRFARKGRGGEIEQAYGFDLSPIVARAEEFRDLAQTVQAEKKAFRVAKERLTLLRRDIVKMIETGVEESVPGNWGRVTQTYQGIIGRLPRSAPRQLVESIGQELQELCIEIRDVLESFTKTMNLDANESHIGRHKQNSNPDSKFESEYSSGKKDEAGGSVAETDNVRSLPKRELPLGIVLDACPEMRELAQGGPIRHWRDLLAAAELARPMLGISPSAWREARETMGDQHAAITLASIYQRAGQINNAGGYLRSLTDRAKDGKFSTWPMVMALLRAKLDEQKNAVGAGKPRTAEEVEDDSRLHVSESLLKNLRKPRSW
ncbi:MULTISPECIES: plasmid replication protein RepC [Rhizobium/Agrobacterium group]|uniref:Replication initiation protein RepC n=3 Tax=Agrobacterium tumefaciens complex TaxID=1183400 RepID=A0A2Z2PHZ4_AGRFC|nr:MULTISPECIES: plasmid replication protein RepC [Rhizobium/Agrobacterium group]AAF00014.1 RepC [Agrobacterium fabrum str. C58]AAK91003.1 replication protein C [Agrobacterium fabrum str. C58]ASK42223.1 replication initiation protein RepC [Agrobacterium sp.]ASK42577.1 replication initiation protein RepC [Agrobacterium fabrum str. C58]ASK43248.1 replication initiation protein RepC [Agrobacterium fabrum]